MYIYICLYQKGGRGRGEGRSLNFIGDPVRRVGREELIPGHPGPRGEGGGGCRDGEAGGRRECCLELGKTHLRGMSAHHVVAVDAVRGVLHAVVHLSPEHRQVLSEPAQRGGRRGGEVRTASAGMSRSSTGPTCPGSWLVGSSLFPPSGFRNTSAWPAASPGAGC